MNSPKFSKYSSKIENYDEHKWTAVHGLRHSIVRFAPALQLPSLSLQYTPYYVQDGIISKHLQLIFGRKRNNRSTCHLFSQDADITSRSVSNRSTSTSKLGVWSLLKVPVRWFLAHRSIVWWSSLICHDCFVSLWFAVRLCVIQLYAHALCQQNIAGPLVLNIMTSNRFHNICPAWDGVWQSSNVFNEGHAFPLSWFSHHLVELI